MNRFAIVRGSFDCVQEHLDSIAEAPPWTLYDSLANPQEMSLVMTDVAVNLTPCTAI